ncbi:hypothetical protein [Roseivivax sp. CAU 1761]
MEMKIRLQDHQPEEAVAEGAPAAVDAKLELQDAAVLIHTDDGRSVWIELEDGKIRVHNYNKSCEAPLNIETPLSGEIVIDRHDYDIERKAENEEPVVPVP